MKRTVTGLLVLAAVVLMSAAVFAGVETTFGGYQWLRYEYKVIGAAQDSAADTSAFSVPRTYIRWKMKEADLGVSANLTLDINNAKGGQEVSATAVSYTSTAVAGKVDWEIFVKNAFVEMKKIPFLADIGMSVKAGVLPMAFGIQDSYWYPVISSNALEDRVVTTADLGMAVSGTIPADLGSYDVSLYNGGGYKKMEDNAEKEVVARLSITPLKDVYARFSFLRTLTNAFGADDKPYVGLNAIAGGKVGPLDAYVEYATKHDATLIASNKSGTGEGWSAFVSYQALDWLGCAARIDAWDTDTGAPNDINMSYILGLNMKAAGDMVLVQLNYQLDQPKSGTGSANDNTNLWRAQVKWSW